MAPTPQHEPAAHPSCRRSALTLIGVRSLFVLVIAWFLACLIPHERGKAEPYPSLLMPAFHGMPLDAEGRVVWMSGEFHVDFADGSTAVVPDSLMLGSVPQSQRQPLMRRVFMNDPPRPPSGEEMWGRTPASRWLRRHVIPGYVLGRQLRERWDGIDPRTAQWLRDELAGRFPARAAVRVTVRHYLHSGGPGLEATRRELAALEIDL